MSRFSASLAAAAPPAVAVEIASHRVSAVAVERRGGRATITMHATEPLPVGAVTPSLTGQNLVDRATVVAVVNRVLEKAGRPRRIGLLIPDPVAKVSLVKFERVPARDADLDQLIRWQVRKSAPFPIEEAQVSYVRGARAEDGQEFIVTLARRAAIEEYESACAPAGAHAGLVDLSTFNVINAALAGTAAPAGDWLLVNVAPEWASLAILRGPHLIFFRSRTADGEGTLADLVHQTAMYYEDRINGGGFERVMLSGISSVSPNQSALVEELKHNLQQRLNTVVETVDPRGAASLTDRISAGAALLDTLTPLVGLLLRDGEAA
jgi:Tfp pilus assembly PilM family ATPase